MPTFSKGRFARVLANLPGSSKFFGPPRGYVNSINDLDFAECRKIARLKNPQCVNHLIPSLAGYPELESQIVQKFQKINEREQELYLLPEARILGSGFFHPVITKRDRFVLEQAAYELQQGSHPAHYALKLPRIKKISGPTFSLVERWSDNYCHWLFECVGKWLLIEKNKSFPEIKCFAALNVSKYPFKKQVLEAIGLKSDQILDIHSSDHILFSELYIADAPYSINLPGADLLDALRMKILPKVSKKSTPPRIFISRGKSGNRRAENEEELEDLLAKHGFEKVILEELSFLDQVELFYNASAIFSQHGAGLVNIIFAQQGAMVLEFFETDFINPCYALLSEKLGLQYRMLANPFYKQFRVGGAWLDKPKSVKIDCKNLEKELSNIQH
jgi:hypothetical protein